MNIVKSEQGLIVKLDGKGSLAFFLQTLLRAKFYDDESLDGLLSPILNGAIKATFERLDADQPEAEVHYSGWVAHWHLDRVRNVISTSLPYLAATASEQQIMMRTALYPYQSTE